MKEFRGNIVISTVAHATFLVMALTLAGGNNASSRVPPEYVAVTLLEDAAGLKPATADNEEKVPAPAQAKKTRLREAAPPEVSLPPEPKESPVTARDVHSLLQETAGAAETGSAKNNDAPVSNLREGGRPGAAPAEMQLTVAGKAGKQGGPDSGNEKTDPEYSSSVRAIRAAIERTKSYPPLARRRGMEGTVTAEFTINAKGYPEDIRIVRSSGHEILDSSARKTILHASPFPTIKGTLQVPITFKIER
jgi:protein TonB